MPRRTLECECLTVLMICVSGYSAPVTDRLFVHHLAKAAVQARALWSHLFCPG